MKKIAIFLMIVGIVALGSGLYLNFSLEEVEDTGTVVKPEVVEKESLDINSDLVQGLYYMTSSGWSRSLNVDGLYHYKLDKVLTSEFKEGHLMEIVFSRLSRKGLLNQTVSEEVVKNEYKEIFGNYVNYKQIDNFSLGCDIVNYDSANKVYNVMYTNCADIVSAESKIIAAYKYNNRVEIEEKVLFSKDGLLYYDPEYLEVADVSIEDEDEKIPVYKYVFMYDSNSGVYYYYSFEKK